MSDERNLPRLIAQSDFRKCNVKDTNEDLIHNFGITGSDLKSRRAAPMLCKELCSLFLQLAARF
jgi:hypothetical protein